MATVIATFFVPHDVAAIGDGTWFWKLASWRGVREANLNAAIRTQRREIQPPHLKVVATETAMARVRRFCSEKGYREYDEITGRPLRKRAGNGPVRLRDQGSVDRRRASAHRQRSRSRRMASGGPNRPSPRA